MMGIQTSLQEKERERICNDKKILVLMGGTSAEREVSLRSGKAVFSAIEKLGYAVEALDLQTDNLNRIFEINPDMVFLALHGRNGEDGTIQGMLELMGIPYTGSGVASSAICIDKVLTKKMLMYEGIATAEFVVLRKEDISELDKACADLENRLGLPMVVKAATQGSSIGTIIVRERNALPGAIKEVFSYDDELLAEKYITGVELTVPVMGNEEAVDVLPIIEITSENEFYDYESKYTPGKCSHIIPARISDDLRIKVEDIGVHTYKTMGCRGVARIDFMVDKCNKPFVLEVNTIPGMTQQSLVPDSARTAGFTFEVLVEKIIKLALEK
jgi:D-alanine-D-alanine ligase